MKGRSSQRPETILFVGAGATQDLSMPTTSEQAQILWDICDCDRRRDEIKEQAKKARCFEKRSGDLADLLMVLDRAVDCKDDLLDRAFPCVAKKQRKELIQQLRRQYDVEALRFVAKAKKGDSKDEKPRDSYLQEVFTLIDACVRDNRGFAVFDGENEIFLSVERLKAAHVAMVLLINTMFACAWQNLILKDKGALKPYRDFFLSLSKLMQEEGRQFYSAGCKPNRPEFYQFSYSLMTTNFEPVFLWLIWQAHYVVNYEDEIRLGNPGRMLKLMMNFPNSVGMSRLADLNDKEKPENLDRCVWSPCTDAAAQMVNSENYLSNRLFRFGKYYPLHGMSVTRHCPMCGRLNLYMGDTWDANSKTLFNNGIIKAFNWGHVARTEKEKLAHRHGEYDALECHFCGELTHSCDNFMFMQTQLKTLPPSFIKETTDEALAGIAGAKHIVLLGYSMPLDDAIWGSLFTAMSRRKDGEKLYCSVAATYDEDGPDGWLYGKELEDYIERYTHNRDEYEKVRAIENAIAVFGKENVRAYVKGIPNVFEDGDVNAVKALMYPCDQLGWDIPSFTPNGVVRS